MLEFLPAALINARKAIGISQSELAKRIGTHQRVLSNIEIGISMPNVRTLLKICNGLGIYNVRPFFRNEIIFRKFIL